MPTNLCHLTPPSRVITVTAVGGTGVFVSAVAVHGKLSSVSKRAMCSAAEGTTGMGGSGGARVGEVEGQDQHLSSADIMLYQYKICPFCNKLKAVMDFLGVPYSVTEVNPLTKKEISFSEDYKKVPIMRMEGKFMRESSDIIQALLDRLRETGAMTDTEHASFCSPDAQRWAEWADKKLAVLLFPNITRNFSESYQAFSYIQDVKSFSFLDKVANQLIGSTAMWAAQSKIKKKYNIVDEREALFVALKDWTDALEGSGPFVGGQSPNLGDLCVFGCIKAIEGLDTHR
ncbi:unnamed protein product [Choristocarpus tenellus]